MNLHISVMNITTTTLSNVGSTFAGSTKI